MRAVSLLLTIIVVITLTLAVGVIRAWPDDSTLETFLFSGCEHTTKPCWAGIVPGETSFDEAMTLLEQHDWVGDIQTDGTREGTYAEWNWNDSAPDFVRIYDGLEPPNLWASENVVNYLTLPTSFAYGRFEQILGIPELGIFQVFRPRSPRGIPQPRWDLLAPNNAYFLAAYGNSQYILETHFYCPSPARMVWDAHTRITLFSPSLMQGAIFSPYNMIRWVYDTPCAD